MGWPRSGPASRPWQPVASRGTYPPGRSPPRFGLTPARAAWGGGGHPSIHSRRFPPNSFRHCWAALSTAWPFRPIWGFFCPCHAVLWPLFGSACPACKRLPEGRNSPLTGRDGVLFGKFPGRNRDFRAEMRRIRQVPPRTNGLLPLEGSRAHEAGAPPLMVPAAPLWSSRLARFWRSEQLAGCLRCLLPISPAPLRP